MCMFVVLFHYEKKGIFRISKLRAFLLQALHRAAPLVTFQGIFTKSRLPDRAGINAKSVKTEQINSEFDILNQSFF